MEFSEKAIEEIKALLTSENEEDVDLGIDILQKGTEALQNRICREINYDKNLWWFLYQKGNIIKIPVKY